MAMGMEGVMLTVMVSAPLMWYLHRHPRAEFTEHHHLSDPPASYRILATQSELIDWEEKGWCVDVVDSPNQHTGFAGGRAYLVAVANLATPKESQDSA